MIDQADEAQQQIQQAVNAPLRLPIAGMYTLTAPVPARSLLLS